MGHAALVEEGAEDETEGSRPRNRIILQELDCWTLPLLMPPHLITMVLQDMDKAQERWTIWWHFGLPADHLQQQVCFYTFIVYLHHVHHKYSVTLADALVEDCLHSKVFLIYKNYYKRTV